ncbi:MAG: hypothetical protein ACOCZ2_01410 [Thermodesulfobacteriota bacterium]
MSRVYLLFTVFVLFIFLGCGGEGSSPTGEQLTIDKCARCHAQMITCSNLDQGKEYWERTVRRMAEKDMDMSEKEQALVVDYLNNLSPGTGPVCD